MNPIKVFFWRGKSNFGDLLSPMVVSHLSGRPTAWGEVGDCDIFAVGSIIQIVRDRAARLPAKGQLPVMWGSGTMDPGASAMLDRVEVVALRGPVTAALMNQSPALPFGDPGLFAAELLDDRPAQGERIGLVPHWSLVETPEYVEMLESDPRLMLIDPRNPDVREVISQIAACRFVLSSSLHGLIVADSLGVPNHWLNPIGIHRFPALKFIDYAASIGRAMGAPLDADQVPDFLAADLPETIPYSAGIEASRQALRDSFPAELKTY